MNWLLSDWRGLLPDPWLHIGLMLGAIVCGAVVGLEREKREKPAGLRTMVMVCLGSAVFTMITFAFGTTAGDTGRVAAQIVSGVGFLGAGVILHGRTAVTGLTTAATIWATAATGMVVGVGYVGAGLGLSIAMRGVLAGIYWWEQYCMGEMPLTAIEILVDPKHGKTRIHLERLMAEFHVRSPMGEISVEAGGLRQWRLSFHLPRHQRIDFLDELALMPEVHEIRELPDQASFPPTPLVGPNR
jgi:putative Mg2+ transporter-C (MgtC) family protein